jgi:hypothetical protein
VSIQVNAVQFHPVCSECALASSFELAVSASHSPPLQVDNEYTDSNRSEGLFLDFSRMSLNVAGKKLSTSMVIPPPPPTPFIELPPRYSPVALTKIIRFSRLPPHLQQLSCRMPPLPPAISRTTSPPTCLASERP